MENTTTWSCLTRSGSFPSGPPPVFSQVSLLAILALNGRGGYSLRAELLAGSAEDGVHTFLEDLVEVCEAL